MPFVPKKPPRRSPLEKYSEESSAASVDVLLGRAVNCAEVSPDRKVEPRAGVRSKVSMLPSGQVTVT